MTKQKNGRSRDLRWQLALVGAVFLLSANPIVAAGPGEAAFVFLKIGTDSRAEALGGAHAARVEGVSALYYNPAGMVLSPPGELLATYNNWVVDIQSGFVGAVTSIGERNRIGAAVQYVDYGDIPRATEQGSAPGESGMFGASDVALSLGVAQEIIPRVAAGVTARYVIGSMDGESATALAFDVGVIYRMPDERTRLAAAVRNAGFETSNFSSDAPKDDLPITGVAGFSHEMRGAPLLFVVDAMKPIDDGFGAGFGVELSAFDPVTLRVGYNTFDGSIESGSDSDNLAGIRVGAGFAVDKLVIDYSYGSLSELGSSHRFTVRTVAF